MPCTTRRLRAAFASIALTLATGLAAAQSTHVIDFNDPALANLYPGFEEIPSGDYRVYFQFDGGLIGGADDLPAATAPTGNPTPFATALNSGAFSLFRADGGAFDLLGFDFAYVPHPDSPPPEHPMVLVIFGGSADAGVWTVDPTPTNQPFARYDDPSQMAAFSNVTSLIFTVCSYDPETQEVCSYTLGTAGQFALDNLSVQTPVPEPAAAWLFGLGLAGLGARRWRQRRAPARPATKPAA